MHFVCAETELEQIAASNSNSAVKTKLEIRLKRLAATLCRSSDRRSFTLEELCWRYWRVDRRGFLALSKGEFPGPQAIDGGTVR